MMQRRGRGRQDMYREQYGVFQFGKIIARLEALQRKLQGGGAAGEPPEAVCPPPQQRAAEE